MAIYVVVSEGTSPEEATPIIATRDQRIVRAIVRAISSTLGADEITPVHRLVSQQGEPPEKKP